MYKSENIHRSPTNKNAWELQQNDVIGQKKSCMKTKRVSPWFIALHALTLCSDLLMFIKPKADDVLAGRQLHVADVLTHCRVVGRAREAF
jgi:hypothetical protein